MIIAQDTPRYSDVVKYESKPDLAFTRELVVVNDTAKTLLLVNTKNLYKLLLMVQKLL